ncbi:single-stranded DNA-binding protein [Enterococcus sp. BWR-S5]|uniref:single-stranded DNA-binding protein n=1 Tax=Enterococcus sp. BWR-S5 TaxID=2787714 RepID=UPI001923BD18|nr:single-stranded DNA-binding protein [Enterococcus sp. BWR-S5]MBL1227273.1 single-stranded DNA-binding protein [Enterococcus sp. BWR-S5]
MKMDNFVSIEGRLAKDPYVNFTKKGTAVTEITVMTTTPTGRSVPVTVKAFSTEKNKIADNMADYLTKGSPVRIEGFNDFSSYTKDGNPIYDKYVNATNFKALESKQQTEERRAKNAEKEKAQEG